MSSAERAKLEAVKNKRMGKGNVDKLFWERCYKLTKTVIPSWTSPEVRYIIILTVLLVIRTMMSIWLADVNGQVVKAIVKKSLPEFIRRILTLFLFAVPSSTVNSGLDFYQKKLALAFRKRLTENFHTSYLEKMHYYKICNLDSRINNPD